VVEKDGQIYSTTVLEQVDSLDYDGQIEMTEAFATYEIYATLDGTKLLKPSCLIETTNQVIAPISNYELI
jgi:hypothetical protein